MLDDHINNLAVFLDMLKAKGVTSYDGWAPIGKGQPDRISVSFATSEPSAPADDAKPPALIEEERCKCGCPLYQHTNDGCGNGCDAEKCGATP